MKIAIELDVPEHAVNEYEAGGIDWKTQARKLVEERFFPDALMQKPTEQGSQVRYPALHAWLQERLQEHTQMTDEEKAEGEREVEELKRNLNSTRAENGERLLFP